MSAVTAVVLETCRGVTPSGCRHAAPLPLGAMAALVELAATAPSPAALAELARPLRQHETFRLAVSACPNACVRPQVADLGLIAVREVTIDPAACHGCATCAEACPDAAITMGQGKAVLNPAACLGCGACVRVCPTKAITAGPVVFRAFLGGRLGRRPRLGSELGCLLPPPAALALARRALDVHAREMRPGRRFGDILFPGGLPGLPAWVWP